LTAVAKITPAAALRDRVEAMHQPGDRITILTDSDSYADQVLVGIRLASSACVMAIRRSEYDGMAILRAIGCKELPVKPAPAGVKTPTTKKQDKKS